MKLLCCNLLFRANSASYNLLFRANFIFCNLLFRAWRIILNLHFGMRVNREEKIYAKKKNIQRTSGLEK